MEKEATELQVPLKTLGYIIEEGFFFLNIKKRRGFTTN